MKIVKKNGKYGLADEEGNLITPFDFDKVVDFPWFEDEDGFVNVMKNGKYGCVDNKGRVIIPPIYDRHIVFNDGIAIVELNGKSGFVDLSGHLLVPPRYDEASPFSFSAEGLAIVQLNGKYGCVNTSGEEVIPPQYDVLENFYEDIAVVGLKGKFGYINTTGKIVIPIQFDEADSFYWNDVAKVKIHGQYGFIDSNGKLVVPAQYDNAGSLCGLAVVVKNGKYGCIDKAGFEVVPPVCDVPNDYYSEELVPPLWHGRFTYRFLLPDGSIDIRIVDDNEKSIVAGRKVVEKNGKYGWFDLYGKQIVPIEYDEIQGINEQELAIVSKAGKYGCVNRDGNIVLPLEYDKIDTMYLSFALVWKGNKCGIIRFEPELEIVLPVENDEIRTVSLYSDSRVVIKKIEKYGISDEAGNEIVPPIYDNVEEFMNGLAKVELDGKYGFINKEGVVVIPIQYDDAESFYNGNVTIVDKNGKYGTIDVSGNVIITPYYDVFEGYFSGIAKVGLMGKFGFVDLTGKVVIPLQYDKVASFYKEDSLSIVCKDGKYGCINTAGTEIVPLMYDDAQLDKNGCIRVCLDEKYGLISRWTGEEIVPLKYDYIEQEECNFDWRLELRENNYWISKLIDVSYEYVRDLRFVILGDKVGCIDSNGNEVLKPQFDAIEELISDRFRFMKRFLIVLCDGKYGYFSSSGVRENGCFKCIYPPVYDEFKIAIPQKIIDESQRKLLSKFYENQLAIVKSEGKYGYVKLDCEEGEVAIPIQYDAANVFSEELAAVQLDGKWGYIDKNGNTIIPFQFQKALRFRNGVAKVKLNENWDYIDTNGKITGRRVL